MDLRQYCYKYITKRISYNNSLDFGVSLNMTLDDVVKETIDYVDNLKLGNSFHATVSLMKMLDNVGIKSELLFRVGKVRIDGKLRNSLIASVLVNEKGKEIVMNPIEDIEFFSKEKADLKFREKLYSNGTTLFKIYKLDDARGVWSWDAANIGLDDFIVRYGDGKIWNLGSLFREGSDKITMKDMITNAKVLKRDSNVIKLKK